MTTSLKQREFAQSKTISPAGSILVSWSTRPDIVAMMGDAQKKALAIWKDSVPLGSKKPREK